MTILSIELFRCGEARSWCCPINPWLNCHKRIRHFLGTLFDGPRSVDAIAAAKRKMKKTRKRLIGSVDGTQNCIFCVVGGPDAFEE